MWAIWTMAGGAAAVLLIVVIMVVSTSKPARKVASAPTRVDTPVDFETENRALLLEMKSQAETFEENDQRLEARAECQKILDLTAGQAIRDAELLAVIAWAREAHERLGRKPAPEPDPEVVQVPATPAPPPSRNEGPAPTTTPLERKPIASAPEVVQDEEIEQAIRRGVAWLKAQRRNGHFDTKDGKPVGRTTLGRDAIATYALLQAGYAIKDEQLTPRASYTAELLDSLRAEPEPSHYVTYSRALRAVALGVYDRPVDHKKLEEDVRWLISATWDGGYYYNAREKGKGSWDNSNSQYGVLGVWAGAERGINVRPSYWKLVEDHWINSRLADGQWPYTKGAGTFGMTCAGLASLFVAVDHGESSRTSSALGRPPYPKALMDGLTWLEQGDNSIRLGIGKSIWSAGYNVYALERVGLASGFKYFGEHDWYRKLSRRIVDDQREDGSWIGLKGKIASSLSEYDMAIPETSYMLLFLSRGRHPILMNKLRYDGAWSNRPRDLVNLAGFCGNFLERPLNWQVVSIDRDWMGWTDSPIAYLAGHEPPKLTDEQIDKLGKFVWAGGLLFTHADGDSESFSQFASELAAKLFPQYTFAELPASHEIHGMAARIVEGPKLLGVSNGSRLLMVHSPVDIAQSWQLRRDRTHRNRFEMGLNLFVYAAGKQNLRNRLSSPYIPMPPGQPAWTVPVARVRFGGNWNPEPYAMERLSAALMTRSGGAIKVTDTPMTSLDAATARLAVLTGTGECAFTRAEMDALKAYVEAGGVVLIDACGGDTRFAAATSHLVEQLFEGKALQWLGADHPIVGGTPTGMEKLGDPQYRLYNLSRQVAGRKPAEGLYILESGRGAVIYTAQDLTTGLLGTSTWGIMGFQPAYALGLVSNTVLWTKDRTRAGARP